MAAVRWALLAVLVAVAVGYVEGAAVRLRRSMNTLPTYDDGFMRKLCAFLGATYVRSAKDPLCWYTWCHAGEPYHMQCPPGRSASQHFYWSSEDPCTETDTKERCVVGYLKSMHLPQDEPNEVLELEREPQEQVHEQEEVEEEEEEEEKEEKEEEEHTERDRHVESKQMRRDVAEQYSEPEMVVTGLSSEVKDDGGYEEPVVNEKSETDLIPEPEPTPDDVPIEVFTGNPKVIIKQIKQTDGKQNSYYPGHRHAHIVDSFVLQNPKRKFGILPKQTTPYIPVYYAPHPYFPRYRIPKRIEPQPQPHAEFLRSENDDEVDAPQNDIIYRKPEGRQAPLSSIQSEEPLYDAEYIDEAYLDVPGENLPKQDDTQTESEDVYVNTQGVAPLQMAAVTAVAPSEVPRENEQEVIDNAIEDYEETESSAHIEDKDPVVYDYFKTHFVERM